MSGFDLASALVGCVVGGGIGYITAAVLAHAKVEDADTLTHEMAQALGALREEHEKLYREYSRLTDRDSRGRFTRKEKTK